MFEAADYMVRAQHCNVNEDWMKGWLGQRMGVLLRNAVEPGRCVFASDDGVTLGCENGTRMEAWSLVRCEA